MVVIRNGANAQDVIDGVKEKIADLEPGLPRACTSFPSTTAAPYPSRGRHTEDGANRRNHSGHARAHDLPVALPQHSHRHAAVAARGAGSFLFMHYADISSNIMSLGGIAIAIGVLVDAGIVMTENVIRQPSSITKNMASTSRRLADHAGSSQAVGRPIFFAMAIIILAFVPVFASRHGRQDVSPAGVHQDFRHGRLDPNRGHSGARALHVSDPRQTASRGSTIP